MSFFSVWNWRNFLFKLKDRGSELFAFVSVIVTDLPSKPVNLEIGDLTASSAELKWNAPQSLGNCSISGYQIEKRDSRSEDWFIVYDKVRNDSHISTRVARRPIRHRGVGGVSNSDPVPGYVGKRNSYNWSPVRFFTEGPFRDFN